MGRRFHLALGVADLAASIADYSTRLGMEPECVVPGVYALWRTEALNLSIRVVNAAEAGQLRHLGWEEPEAAAMETSLDVNGMLWEPPAHRRRQEQHQGRQVVGNQMPSACSRLQRQRASAGVAAPPESQPAPPATPGW